MSLSTPGLDELLPAEQDDPSVVRHLASEAKYGGYIARQEEQVERFRRLEDKPLPEGWDYLAMAQLRVEAREKLHRTRPRSLGQASRISGLNPADIATLLVYLRRGPISPG